MLIDRMIDSRQQRVRGGLRRGVGFSMWLARFVFFSGGRRHTRLTCDWSSDVCSSDLLSSGRAPRRCCRLCASARRAARSCGACRTRRSRTSTRRSSSASISRGAWAAPSWNLPRSSRLDRKSTRLNSSHMSISYAVFCLRRRPPGSTLFPYTTLFRSAELWARAEALLPTLRQRAPRCEELRRLPDETIADFHEAELFRIHQPRRVGGAELEFAAVVTFRSEEHTSELQSHVNLVCRLLLETASTGIYTLSLHDALPIC